MVSCISGQIQFEDVTLDESQGHNHKKTQKYENKLLKIQICIFMHFISAIR